MTSITKTPLSANAIDTSTEGLIARALVCPTTGARMRDPVVRFADGWAYDQSVANKPAPTHSPRTGRALSDAACVPHRLLRTLLALPKLTPAAILQHACPITMDAPLALPTLTLAGHTYSGAVYRWHWHATPGEGREPLTGDSTDLAALQDDHTMALLIDIAASENYPAHRAVLSGIAPDVGVAISDINILGDTPLCLAAKYGNAHIVQDLLALAPKAVRDHANQHARTALGHAVANHHLGTAMLLADAGAALGPVDAQGWTPWGRALWNSYLQPEGAGLAFGMDAFYTLLHAPQSHASIDMPMAHAGLTPMHIAATLGLNTQVVDLFEAGASCDIADASGVTVRHMLAERPEFTWERFS